MEVKEIISSGLLELYATGLASSEEAAQVLQWADQYAEVAKELNQIQTGLDMFTSANAIQPDSSVKDKIFARINEGETAKVVPFISKKKDNVTKAIPISSFWKMVAAAMVVLLIGSAVLNISLYKKNNDIAAQLNQSEQLISRLENKSRSMENDLQVVQSKYSMPVSLNGMEATPDAAAKVFWMKNTGDVYIDPTNLPETPQGMQYHLWAIIDSKPVDAGVVIKNRKGDSYRIQKMKTFGRVEAFAVSLEVATDKVLEAPKGQIYVMGKM